MLQLAQLQAGPGNCSANSTNTEINDGHDEDVDGYNRENIAQ
jgi:hypothetical protein